MNRIFFTGRAGGAKILFTPRGEKIALFTVKIEGFDTVEVLYLDSEGKVSEKDLKGKNVMVFGTLVKPEGENGKILRVKAKNIEPMEE